jgi:hypothetical protein
VITDLIFYANPWKVWSLVTRLSCSLQICKLGYVKENSSPYLRLNNLDLFFGVSDMIRYLT